MMYRQWFYRAAPPCLSCSGHSILRVPLRRLGGVSGQDHGPGRVAPRAASIGHSIMRVPGGGGAGRGNPAGPRDRREAAREKVG